MIEQHPVLEHGTTKTDRWLRKYRLRISVSIAVAEAVLLVFGAIDRWGALLVAAGVIVGYFLLEHRLRWQSARDVLWIGAVSQALVALVPVLVILVGTLTLIAVGFLAAIALIVLFTDRR